VIGGEPLPARASARRVAVPAAARVYVVDSTGEITSLVQQVSSNPLHGLTRRYSTRP